MYTHIYTHIHAHIYTHIYTYIRTHIHTYVETLRVTAWAIGEERMDTGKGEEKSSVWIQAREKRRVAYSYRQGRREEYRMHTGKGEENADEC
jgi:hypothetical protein